MISGWQRIPPGRSGNVSRFFKFKTMTIKIPIHIPEEKKEEVLLQAIYILGNFHKAVESFDQEFGWQNRKTKDYWKGNAKEFLESIGYVAPVTEGWL